MQKHSFGRKKRVGTEKDIGWEKGRKETAEEQKRPKEKTNGS